MHHRLKQLEMRLRQRAALDSGPAAWSLTHELLRIATRKLQWSAGGYANRMLLEPPWLQAPASKTYFEQIGDSGPRLHVIVVPNVLHFLVPAIRLLPESCAKGFLLNGAAGWEADYLHRCFPKVPHPYRRIERAATARRAPTGHLHRPTATATLRRRDPARALFAPLRGWQRRA